MCTAMISLMILTIGGLFFRLINNKVQLDTQVRKINKSIKLNNKNIYLSFYYKLNYKYINFIIENFGKYYDLLIMRPSTENIILQFQEKYGNQEYSADHISKELTILFRENTIEKLKVLGLSEDEAKEVFIFPMVDLSL